MNEIGGVLREARERRGQTLAEVEEAIKIRLKYLEALECGRVECIPGDVYLKGFLRSYGNFLGLDGAALVERYKALGKPAPPSAPTLPEPAAGLSRAPSAPGAGRNVLMRPATASGVAARAPAVSLGEQRVSPALIWGGGLFALAVALGVGYSQLGRSIFSASSQPPPAASPPAVAVPSPPVAVAAAPAVAAPARVEKGVVSTSGDTTTLAIAVSGAPEISFQATATDNCWLQASADGKLVFEGTLAAGQSVQWRAQTGLRIRVGYPAGLDATINGRGFKPLEQYDNPFWLEVSLAK